MKKWEYRVEGISVNNFIDKNSIKEIKEFLSQLGTEGWELIQAIPVVQDLASSFVGNTSTAKKSLFIFKKEIE